MNVIVLAGGCFWGLQKYFDQFDFLKTQTGYANGLIAHPSYEQVCNGSGHTEAVRIEYDRPELLPSVLDLFFQVIDPTSLNRQGNDVGINYRSGIYCTTEKQLEIAQLMLKDLQERYRKPIVVEAMMLENYYSAEEYHQKYLDKVPYGYCHIPAYRLHGQTFPSLEQVENKYPGIKSLM